MQVQERERDSQGNFLQLGNGTEVPVLRLHSKSKSQLTLVSQEIATRQKNPQLSIPDLTQATVVGAALDLAIEKHLHYPPQSNVLKSLLQFMFLCSQRQQGWSWEGAVWLPKD